LTRSRSPRSPHTPELASEVLKLAVKGAAPERRATDEAGRHPESTGQYL
jgi:hypothetical protein